MTTYISGDGTTAREQPCAGPIKAMGVDGVAGAANHTGSIVGIYVPIGAPKPHKIPAV